MTDFETHPRGTCDELRLARELVASMSREIESYGAGIFPQPVLQAYYRLYGQYIRQVQSEEL